MMEVGLVTISGRTGLTTSVGDAGMVITLSPVVAKTGGDRETTVISPTGSARFRSHHLLGHFRVTDRLRLVREQVVMQDIQLCNIYSS